MPSMTKIPNLAVLHQFLPGVFQIFFNFIVFFTSKLEIADVLTEKLDNFF